MHEKTVKLLQDSICHNLRKGLHISKRIQSFLPEEWDKKTRGVDRRCMPGERAVRARNNGDLCRDWA